VTRRQLVVVAVVWAGFAVSATWRTPSPGVNEPHYLCKAKHFSEPAWCARDLFLASADVHWVFYATFGPLTRVLSFDQTAWIGRIVVWGLLACGWVRLASRIVPGRYSPVWSAFIFLALQATGNLSGEWLIGGLESKGFAYAALLFALAAACQESWLEAGVASGVAVSFNPIIGVWGLVALVAASSVGWASQPVRIFPDPQFQKWHAWRRRLLPAALCILCSLPGLIPAAKVLARRPTADEARVADEIQVFHRLKHHLDPLQFRKVGYWSYAAMLVVWPALRRLAESNAAERLFARFVLATLVIAGAGLAVGVWLRSPGLMKFYPFRLFDLFLPIALSMTGAGLLERLASARREGRPAYGRAAAHMLACAAFAWTFLAPGRAANASRWPPEKWSAFVEACHWIEEHAPDEAVVLTPRDNVGFKWYAQRAEYVTWKDCPQDAAGLLEWGKRINRVNKIKRRMSKSPQEQFSVSGLAELHDTIGVDYVLAEGPSPDRIEPVYRNLSFSVYVTHPARE